MEIYESQAIDTVKRDVNTKTTETDEYYIDAEGKEEKAPNTIKEKIEKVYANTLLLVQQRRELNKGCNKIT